MSVGADFDFVLWPLNSLACKDVSAVVLVGEGCVLNGARENAGCEECSDGQNHDARVHLDGSECKVLER